MAEDFTKALGARIRELRNGKGLSLRECAKAMNISYGFLGDIERGRTNPSLQTLRSIAQFFGVSVESIVGENEESESSSWSSQSEFGDMARRIRYLRKQQDVDQKRFAEAIGVTAETVAAYENGTQQPDPSVVIRMAEYCKVTPGYLYGKHDLVNDELPSGAAEGWREDSLLRDIIEDYRQLPPDVREEIRDYIAFVRARQTLRKQRREQNPN